MTKSAIAVAAARGRPVTFVSSLTALLPRAVAVATLSTFCVVGVARAQDEPEIGGRWVAVKRPLVLDISRCGTGWCGLVVTDGSVCGKTVMRVEFTRRYREAGGFGGHIEIPGEARSYAIQISYREPGDGRTAELFLLGNIGNTIDLWRRSFPLNEVLISSGPALCEPKVS
jgi:uncharacterized protein (DUF2147 family)